MDFFAQQDRARGRTKWLVVLFALAVLGVAGVLYGLWAVVLNGGRGGWNLRDFATIFGGVGGIMLLGSLFKLAQLSGGGAVVARELGGREVDPSTTDKHERRLLNIVEEMAIASGIPAPGVWVMDHENAINAFAAGTNPGNAVVGVTRGCLLELNRSELQGVVAHEFAHILNGDMRLNMRLMGWIFGIIMLALLGRILMNSIRFSSSRSREGNQAVIAIFAIGIAVFLVGSIGSFFGRLIQAAISRQREYLADASAVQFTRDPDGLKGALIKIGALAEHGQLRTSMASEASHMFFAKSSALSLATHPPLPDRIKALDPSWDGQMRLSGGSEIERRERDEARRRERAEKRKLDEKDFTEALPAIIASQAMQQLGQSEEQNVAKGHAVHEMLQERWVSAAHNRDGAKALVYGLLLGSDGGISEGELRYLEKTVGPEMTNMARQWHDELGGAHSAIKIAVIDVAIASLRRLTNQEYATFREVTQWLIASDARVDLFEYMMQRMVRRHLDGSYGIRSKVRPKNFSLAGLQDEVGLVLSAISELSGNGDEAFARGGATYLEKCGGTLTKAPRLDLKQVEKALQTCERAPAVVRRDIIQVCAEAVMADDVVTSREIELLRAVADAMGVAVPPFVTLEAAA